MDAFVVVEPIPIALDACPPFVLEQHNARQRLEAACISVNLPEVSVWRQLSPIVEAKAACMCTEIPLVTADIFSMRQYNIDRRSRRMAWQAKLGKRMDLVRGKLHDNSLLLSSHPTDMLRIRTERDPRSYDVLSRTIVSSEVLPIVLPVLKDIPMRRVSADGVTSLSLSITDVSKPIEVYSALSNQLHRDDLLLRIIHDQYSDEPYLLVLQVKDELATFSYASLLYIKYSVALYDEDLPPEVVEKILQFAKKREVLTW